MLAIAIAITVAGTSACPYGNVEFVSSQAKADATIRFVNSQAAAQCVVRWTTVAPGPGYWREVSSFPDIRLFEVSGIADFTVFAE